MSSDWLSGVTYVTCSYLWLVLTLSYNTIITLIRSRKEEEKKKKTPLLILIYFTHKQTLTQPPNPKHKRKTPRRTVDRSEPTDGPGSCFLLYEWEHRRSGRRNFLRPSVRRRVGLFGPRQRRRLFPIRSILKQKRDV